MPDKTYSFKNSSRVGKDILNEGIRDKHINVAPNQYETAKYNCTTVVDPKNKWVKYLAVTLIAPTN